MAEKSDPLPLNYHGQMPRRPKPPETSETIYWRRMRIAFRACLGLLFVVIAWYLGPNVMLFGKLTRLSVVDFVPTVEQFCVPTVRAMKEYERDRGHPADTIEDLVPKYLPELPKRSQFIEGKIFLCFAQCNHQIWYDTASGREGWHIRGPLVNGTLPVPIVTIGPSTVPGTRP